jgi:Tol biopolymer transport system component
VAGAVILLLHMFFIEGALSAAGPTTERVSLSDDGLQAGDHSYFASISGDGQYVAFASWDSNLVPGDTNGSYDVFVRDRQDGTTRLVSVSSNGTQGSGSSSVPSISADGRFVAFHSNADNLVSGDTNERTDVFVHNLETGETEVVSVNGVGAVGNGTSYFSSISADGRYVVFESDATNLVHGDSNGLRDVFVHDRQAGVTSCISTGGDGISYDATISGDGRYVAFTTRAGNFLWSSGTPGQDATKIIVPIDTNGLPDVYVYDQLAGTMVRVSVATDGTQGNGWSFHPAISEHGDVVAFMSTSSNLVAGDTNGARDVFVHTRSTLMTERIAEFADNFEGLGRLSVSGNGRFVAFASSGTAVVPGDSNGVTDVFIHDRAAEVTERVSLSTEGLQGNGYSMGPALSLNGKFVAFESVADNLVVGDSNGESDVFVRSSWPMVVVFADGFEYGAFEGWSATSGFDQICLRHHDSFADDYFLILTMLPVEDGGVLAKFAPPIYPFSPSTVEIGFTQGGGSCSWLDFDVVFYDDDGPGGGPGTFLGLIPASTAYVPQMPSYEVPSTNVSGRAPTVTTGSVYVGTRWNWSTSRQVAVAMDTSPNTPLQESYFTMSGGDSWLTVSSPGFRSFFIRLCGH